MGEARVNASMLGSGDIAFELQELTTRVAWGEVWQREGLDWKCRSAITVAMLIALNRSAELKAHILGALNNGLSVEEIREIVIHAAVYCGFPAALEGMRVLREVYDDRHLRPRSEIPTNPPQSD
ncbi:carboxymuconolactone decarboxylase family protein [Sphingobium baderi]|uniref:carboxymuconolactone decarboxylase family protein n=1 Tax=Sphingobium baderi TaxID=1332080 RepID=UPI002B4028E8|nr:carboxymuconolactone decarboxylase family protein [Sphingobium baderi]WRD77055.1 carboxymuconolactone decarboxylase family protein [Sphingobium baderi]